MSSFLQFVARHSARLRIALLATALAVPAVLSIPATKAFADCQPAAGPNVTCSGTTNNPAGDGFGDGTQNNFTINVLPGATVTGSDNGISLGADNTVINAGTITGLNFNGVSGLGGFLTVFNSGVISAPNGTAIFGCACQDVFVTNTKSGVLSGVIGIEGNNVTLTNNGTIAANTFGVLSNTSATIFNTGSITTTSNGFFSAAIFVGGDINVINSGLISSPANAIVSQGGNVNLVNTGTVSGMFFGVQAFNGAANVTNFGSISGSLESGNAGILGLQVNITNFGTISGDTAIVAGPAGGSVLDNSGKIVGNFAAIDFSLSGFDTLTFRPGSRIVGAILPGFFDTINIHTGRDIAWMLTFGTCTCDGIVGTGSTVNFFGKGPYVLVGDQIATLDPTAFGLADKNLMDFTGWVSSLLAGRLGETSGATGQGATAFAAASSNIVDTANAAFASAIPVNSYAAAEKGPGTLPNAVYTDRNSGLTFWTKAFAGVRHQDGDDVLLASRSNAYGGAVGVDTLVRPDLRLGLFFGAGYGKFEADQSSQTIESDYFFGGGYGRFDWSAHFLDFAVTAGHSSNDNKRLVANNFAPNGLETATSKYDGWFVSPEIAYGIRIPLASDIVLTPVARVRYLTGHFDGYNESGSAQNLVVAGRDLQDLEERLELNLSRYDPLFGGVIKTTATAGFVGLQRIGDKTISTVLLGQNLAFATPGDNASWGGYVGLGFDYRASQRVNLFAGVEGMLMDDKSRTGTVKGGARIAF